MTQHLDQNVSKHAIFEKKISKNIKEIYPEGDVVTQHLDESVKELSDVKIII